LVHFSTVSVIFLAFIAIDAFGWVHFCVFIIVPAAFLPFTPAQVGSLLPVTGLTLRLRLKKSRLRKTITIMAPSLPRSGGPQALEKQLTQLAHGVDKQLGKGDGRHPSPSTNNPTYGPNKSGQVHCHSFCVLFFLEMSIKDIHKDIVVRVDWLGESRGHYCCFETFPPASPGTAVSHASQQAPLKQS
jgi:hypothetical protein